MRFFVKIIRFELLLFICFGLYSCHQDKKQESIKPPAEKPTVDSTWIKYHIRDSIEKANELEWEKQLQDEKNTFYSYKKISPKEIEEIKLVINKWLRFYKLDLSQARLAQVDKKCFNCPPDKSSIYYREFTPDDDVDTLRGNDYSPNKQCYVSLGIWCNYKNGKPYFVGWDDCQEIYLTDRKLKQNNLILWFGTSTFAEAVFWKNDNVFIIVGHDESILQKRFISIFDIAQKTTTSYELLTNDSEQISGYMEKVNLKEKGIVYE